MDTPWDRAKAQQKSQKQEKRIGNLPGGRKQINSGRNWFSKRDVRLGGYLVEARITDAQSYTIKKKEFEQITSEAIQTPPGMLPAMMLEIAGLRLVVTREQDHMFMEQRVGILEGDIDTLMKRIQEIEAELEP